MVSTVGVSVADVRVLPLFEIIPVTVGKFVTVNVCPARPPVKTVPVTEPTTALVQLPSLFTVYVNENWKLSEPAPSFAAGNVIPMVEPVTVPVPSPLNVRIPSAANDCPKVLVEPPVGVKSELNVCGETVSMHAALPVNA